jgi:hypothetical protein
MTSRLGPRAASARRVKPQSRVLIARSPLEGVAHVGGQAWLVIRPWALEGGDDSILNLRRLVLAELCLGFDTRGAQPERDGAGRDPTRILERLAAQPPARLTDYLEALDRAWSTEKPSSPARTCGTPKTWTLTKLHVEIDGLVSYHADEMYPFGP